jgi:hypothetical protein
LQQTPAVIGELEYSIIKPLAYVILYVPADFAIGDVVHYVQSIINLNAIAAT